LTREPPEPQQCKVCPGSNHGFCGRLPEPIRKRFREVVRRVAPQRLTEGNEKGFSGWDLAVISRGTLTVGSTFEDGRRAITDFLIPGEVLHAREDGDRSGHDVTASPDFLLCLIPKFEADFDAAECRCIERHLRSDAIGHIDALRDRIAALARLDPPERIAYLLLSLRERLSSDGQVVNLFFSRNDIADLLGMRAETVSRAMLTLEEANLIRRDGPRRIEILDPPGLAAIASG